MIKEALKYLVDLGQVKTFDIGGYTYTTQNLSRVLPPKPEPLIIHSLDGLIDFIKAEDTCYHDDLCIHIQNHATVSLYSKLQKNMSRYSYAEVHAIMSLTKYNFYFDLETFIITLQTHFAQTGEVEKILKLVGNIKDSNIRQYGDDGVTQTVTAKTGIATVEDVIVPNPVVLAPYRTFTEIIQPESNFVFRLKKNNNGEITAALFETDDKQWMLNAMDQIYFYLKNKLEEIGIVGVEIIK